MRYIAVLPYLLIVAVAIVLELVMRHAERSPEQRRRRALEAANRPKRETARRATHA